MKAYFLPDISFSEKKQTMGGLSLALPKLEPSQLLSVSKRLKDSQEKLAEASIFDIVVWIDQAAAHWRNRKDPARQEAENLLPEVCGLSKEMVQIVLDELFKQLTRPALLQFVEAELGNPEVLDRFFPKKKGVGLTRAYGPCLTTHLLPGNILGLSIISLVCCLLVKSANLMRVSQEEILLSVLFAQSLEAVWPEMAQNIGILSWNKDQEEMTSAAFQKADLVIVYGSDTSIADIRKMIPPEKRAIYHGHKLSLGVIARESYSKISDASTLAEHVVTDTALYDQRGCLSPHLYYVESGGEISPLEFAEQIAEAFESISSHLPKGKPSSEESSRIQQLRGALPVRGGTVFSSPSGVEWTVLYDPEQAFTPSPLSRTLWIKPVQDLSDLPSLIKPVRRFIQAVGVAIPETRSEGLIDMIAKLGGCRICPIGEMQRPPLSWHHDGMFRLLPLLRFVNWEK